MINGRQVKLLKILIFLSLEKGEARDGREGPGQRSVVSDGGDNLIE